MWRARMAGIASGYCSHSRVLPSMSVNRKVTVPPGGSGNIGAIGRGAVIGGAPPGSARAAVRKTSRSSAFRFRASASWAASWREGRRSPCSNFLIVAAAQKTCCASACWVRSCALRSRRRCWPNNNNINGWLLSYCCSSE